MVDYKLRLGDGTTFSVDEKGLTTWLQGGLVDDKARVQPAGSKKWFTLKQVLAAQGEQRGHAVRHTEKGRADVDRQAAEETAEIERKVAEQRAAEERKAGDDLAAAERKAAAERTVAERKLIEEREAAERWAIQEREEEQARIAAEQKAEQERVEAERRATEERAEAERREAEAARREAEAERREAEAREGERVAAAEAKVAAERAERAERKRKAEQARLEAEQQAAEEARLAEERKAAEDARLAAERKAAQARAAQRKAEEERAAAARLEAEAREAAAREAERLAEAERQVAEERAERAERKRRAEEERLAAERAADERAAADRRVAAERAAAERAAREREAAVAALHAATPEPPPTEIAIEPAATMVKVEDFERELGLVPVMFDDGTGTAAGRAPAGSSADRAPRAPSRERSDSEAALRTDSVTGVMKPPTAVDTTVMRLLKVLDRGVVWLVATLKGMLARRATTVEPGLGLGLGHGPSAPEPARVPVPEPPRPTVAPPAPERPRPAAATSTAPPPWAAPSVPPPRSQPNAPVSSKQQAAPQREAAVPPPSYQKLEVIPFAAAPAKRAEEEDVWGGDDPWQEPGAMASAFSVAWRWTKRLTIAIALIATVAALALNQQKWMPQAQDAANVLGQNVDKLSERATVRSIPPERIEAARAEIPYLRAETIELILLKSPGAPEPAEVFRRAHQAVETARPRLPDKVAAEIDNLTGAAAAGLDEAEGEKLRAYLAALRAGTSTAAYQDKEAVWLMARGVRRLSAEQLALMEELFAQAVTAALQPPV